MFVVTKQEMVSEAQTRALNAPDANFLSGLGAAAKWHETIQNMSFRPKVVDWACLLKKQEMVLEAQTRALNVPRYQFLQRVKCGYEMAWNHPKHKF